MNIGKPLSKACVIASCALCMGMLAGCVGYVGDGGYYAPGPVIEPDVVFFGGYDRGHDVHDYSRRGHESRSVVVHHDAPRRGGGRGGRR